MIPVSFDDYTFNRDHILRFEDNFQKLDSDITTLVGVSGGLNQYGLLAAPATKGKVTVEFWLHAVNQADMASKLTAIGNLSRVGRAQLWRETWDGQRQFCWAYLADAPKPQAYRAQPEKRLQVKLTFDVPDPRWFGYGTNTALWDSVVWGAFTWGGTPTTLSISAATSGTATLTNNGNVPVEVAVTLTPTNPNTAVSPTISRLVNGAVVDWLRWNNTLASTELLIIDPRAKKVLNNGISARDDFEYLTANWLTLEPGANTILVQFEAATTATVRFYHWEAFR